MAVTDDPLKLLVETCIADFAAWLLNAEVVETHALNVELPGQSLRVDQVYRVKLADGRFIKLHIEFQGQSSHEPMSLRMLEYMTRQVRIDPDLALHSVVLYVGRGAGVRDEGVHSILGADGMPVLTWRYQVVRLWQMPATDLLAANRPALLALVGQTVIDDPAVILPQVVDRLESVADRTLRQRLFTSLVALMNNEEMVMMIEKLVEDDEFVIDTPFLRRLREKAQIEAKAEGRAEGRVEGRAEGRAEGVVQGILNSRRQAVLNVITWRFDPPVSVFQQIEQVLATIEDDAQLASLHKTAVQANALADFQATLNRITPPIPTQSE